MSFTDDFLKGLEKRNVKQSWTKQNDYSQYDDYTRDFLTSLEKRKKKKEEEEETSLVEDIAPVRSDRGNPDLFGLDFVQKGAFDDGYQFGDVSKAILGTAGDIGYGLFQGIGGLAEGLVDGAGNLAAGVADLLGYEDEARSMRQTSGESQMDSLEQLLGVDDFLEKYSVAGNTLDAVGQSIGQMGTVAAASLIHPALGLGLLGASSLGSGMSEAYQGNATDEEALQHGVTTAAADVIFEMLSGGLGKSFKALGFGKGLFGLDDMAAKAVSKFVKGQTGKNIAEFFVKSGFEGLEEVGSGFAQAVSKKLTYMSEDDFGKILEDENLFEQFMVGSLTSGIMQAGDVKTSIKTGQDFITGLTQNEQTVVDSLYESEIADKDLDKKEKQKIYDQILTKLDKGYVSTDDIESILGGETYKAYKDTLDSEKALKDKLTASQKEYNELKEIHWKERSQEQNSRLAELETEIKNLETQVNETTANSKLGEMKSQLSKSVFELTKSDTKLQESYREEMRRGQDLELDVEQYKGAAKITAQNLLKGGMNNTNRVHDVVNFLTKLSADKNIVFDVATAQKLADAGLAVDGKQVNGVITKDGIVLNLESSAVLETTVGHEITHALEGTEHYEVLKSAIKEYAELKGVYADKYSSLESIYAKKDAKGNILKDANGNTVWIRDDVDIDSEVVADLVGEYLFTDADFINNLSVKHRNVFQKIYDEIKYLWKLVTAGSDLARKLEKVKMAFDKAYRESKASTASTEATVETDATTNATETNAEAESLKSEIEQLRKWKQEARQETKDTIAGLQAEYDAIADKDSAEAKTILKRIELQKANGSRLDSQYANEIAKLSQKLKEAETQSNQADREYADSDVKHSLSESKTLYTGSPVTDIQQFKVGGANGAKQTGDRYGRGIYLTTNKTTAKGYAGDSGRVYEINADDLNIFDLNDPITEEMKATLHRELNGKDKQFRNSVLRNFRTEKTFTDFESAEKFFDAQRKVWKEEDGYYSANKPEIKSADDKTGIAVIEYTDFVNIDNAIGSLTGNQLYDALKSISTDDFASFITGHGFDGIAFDEDADNQQYVIYRNEDRLNILPDSNVSPSAPYTGAEALNASDEVKYSLSNDTDHMNNAISLNDSLMRVDSGVMADAKALREKIAKRMNAIKDKGLVGLPEDVEGNTYIANSSYDGTEENTTICPRSLASEAFMDAVSEYLGRPLTVEEQIYISQDLQGRTLTPECLYCYVATDRKAYRAFLGEYVQQRDSVIQKLKDNANADTSRSGELYKEFLGGRKDTKPMYNRFKMWVDAYKNGTPMIDASHLANINKLMGDINSEFGEDLRPQIVDAMKYAQSASWAKKRVNYVAYNGHILKWKQDRINKLNSHYGLRMYSFSDFHPAFVLENMQMITDASVRGLKMLGYTKDTDFVDIFAPTGMNINVSTFGFESGGNVYENNIIGANWEKAKELRSKYPNVGVTFVATNDTLVNWALEQDWIDVIIPYHLVRTGAEVAKALNYTNYTSESADTKDAGWTKGKDKKYIAPTEHNNDKATYLEALAKNHLKPRFERFIDNPNYMKLVNECRQPASDSKPVQPIFNESAAMEALAKLETNGYYQPIGGSVNRMYEIAGEVAEAMVKELAPVKHSISDPNDIAPVDFQRSAKYLMVEKTTAQDFGDVAPTQKHTDAPVATDDEEIKAETLVDRDSFVVRRAKELYEEITNLKKGVRASKSLGYLLDHGHEWRSIKTALLNIRDNPNQVVNENSAAESVAREMLGREYDEMVYELNEQTDVAGSIRTKMKSIQTEIDNNEKLREQANADYDAEIAEVQAKYDAKKNKNTIEANNLLRRIERLHRMKNTNDANYAKRIGDLEARLEKMSQPTYKTAVQRRKKQSEYTELMESLVGDTSTWVDKKLGISYKVNTLRRNLRDIVRDASGKQDIAKADAIYDELQGNYNRHEAELKRESKRLKQVFADMKLTSAEDTYAHMLGEFRHNPDSKLTEETVKEYYEQHKKDIDTAKVDKAIEEARKTFDELIARVNERLREQGMKEIPYRQGYFPHFTNPKQGFLAKLFNWKPVDHEIPTSIAGITETFNPERSWQSFNKQRKSDLTDYSLAQGLDTYIHGSLDWIYHIEDIQKRRALENYIRYTHSEEGVKARIDAIRNSEELDADEMQDQIDLVYAEANNPLNNFVTDLRAGTNTLAAKKSSMDRALEEKTNRKIYSVMTNLNNRVNANMVVGSISSALTNFIPIVQSWVEVSPMYSLRGMGDTIRATARDDGIINKSTFLTNRLIEEEKLYKTGWDKASDKAAILMNAIDSFTSQTVWRSKYLQNISEGMSETEAIHNADQFAENVIAGRSRGNMPTIFDAKNPLTKVFTAFQLEVANQYGYMFKDAPTDSKNKARLVKGFATMFIGSYLYNALYSSLVGRNAAFDPLSIIEDLLGDLEDEEEEEAIVNLANNVIEEIPFVGGLLGGGRIPISSALPYSGEYEGFSKLVTDISDENWENVGREMLSPLYYLVLPFGGGQVKKTNEGLGMFSEDHPIAGSYTASGNLRFPVEDNFINRMQAALFGQYASQNARDYFDNNRTALKEKQIQEFIDVDIPIRDYWEYREGLSEQKTIEDKFDYIAGLDLPVAKKNILINNIVDREESVDLEGYEDFSTYEEFDFATKNPEKYTVAKAVGGFNSYTTHYKAMNDISADKDENGKSITGSRKEKIIDYVNSLDIDYGMKIILFKSEYKADDTYNADILEYLNSRDDLTYDEIVTILTELDFTVDGNGNVYWD